MGDAKFVTKEGREGEEDNLQYYVGYIAQIQIHIGSKNKYNNGGQIRYVVVVGVVVVVVGVVRNVSIRVRCCDYKLLSC